MYALISGQILDHLLTNQPEIVGARLNLFRSRTQPFTADKACWVPVADLQ
jgi:hypothetical protein